MIKIFGILLIFTISGEIFSSVLLKDKKTQKNSPQARKLVVYPGFNEIEVTSSFKNELKDMIERVRNLKSRLQNFQHQTIRDVSSVLQKLDAQTDKNALDNVLNEMFISQQNKNE